jgi:antitoxin (DNA-binding transcriptional repressor) of toxin-antitoxin stability system
MKTVSFTDFRKSASHLFTEVENGATMVVLRHGKPIAEIIPIENKAEVSSWKRPGLRLSLKGAQLSSAIIEERKNESLP